jgi:5-methylcytosine-specific restriction protein A
MSRSVALWVGSSDDAAIPKAVKLRIWTREGGKCSLTGRKIMVGDAFDYEHRIPLSMGGRHAEDNIVLALREAHKLKSAEETTARAKADRIKLKHLGQWPAPIRKMPNRPFPKRGGYA